MNEDSGRPTLEEFLVEGTSEGDAHDLWVNAFSEWRSRNPLPTFLAEGARPSGLSDDDSRSYGDGYGPR